jgi:KaiC domain protein
MNKVTTGIQGLDGMLGGGFPEGHTIVLVGTYGTGKTTFALQFIWEGLQKGESGIFITLEEDQKSIIETAAGYGWDLKPHIEAKRLQVVKLKPEDAKTTVTRIKSELPTFIKGFNAKRIVFDSVTLLGMLFETETEKREQLFNLSQLVKSTGATTLLTAEADPKNPGTTKDGLSEYVSDGVLLLRYNTRSDINEVVLSIQIIKMRRQKHSRKIKPYAITDTGIAVHTDAEVF